MHRSVVPLAVAVAALAGPSVATAADRGVAVLRLKTATVLHASPAGARIGTVRSVTRWGQRSHLLVVERRGRWLRVESEALGANGRRAWVRLNRTMRLQRPLYRMRLDLSRRTLIVLLGTRVRWRVHASIGRPESPTPTGLFHISDRFSGFPWGGAFGYGVLALSGFQPNLPAGWRGGSRLAFHGATTFGERIGSAVSAGCPHLAEPVLRRLIAQMPLGTPVVIHH